MRNHTIRIIIVVLWLCSIAAARTQTGSIQGGTALEITVNQSGGGNAKATHLIPSQYVPLRDAASIKDYVEESIPKKFNPTVSVRRQGEFWEITQIISFIDIPALNESFAEANATAPSIGVTAALLDESRFTIRARYASGKQNLTVSVTVPKIDSYTGNDIALLSTLRGGGENIRWAFPVGSLYDVEVIGSLETIDISLRAFIPCNAVSVSLGKGYTWALFAGDGHNSPTYRAFQQAKIRLKPQEGFSLVKKDRAWGESKRYRVHQGHSVGDSNWCWEIYPSEQKNTWAAETLPVTEANNNLYFERISGTEARIRFVLAGANPVAYGFIVAPDLDCVIQVYVRQYNGKRYYRILGDHDGFPAYELRINNRLVYSYDPLKAGGSPISLFAPMDRHINIGWTEF